MRVRDVEIALVLAREMKDAAARDVDASLRLEQLKEVFGAEDLEVGERARIQTALHPGRPPGGGAGSRSRRCWSPPPPTRSVSASRVPKPRPRPRRRRRPT